MFPPSFFEDRCVDFQRLTHRSSKVNISIFEGRHIDLRKSTHRSLKVDTSIIDLQRSTHRSSKVDTSISEGRHIDLRKSLHRSSKKEGGNIAPTTQHRTDIPTIREYISNLDSVRYNIRRSYTRPYTHIRQRISNTSYVLYAYLYCVYALVGGAISICGPYICAVSRICANESHAVFHRPVVCAVKTQL